ncbi:hypothetical protein ABZT17_28160 [Streptomyces sp. NPDC005648]|uniref:hypothetical protein n=1 Tax=Streptomyces sp. NPDC005648 TaxID=3157044 RepID=UPI0033AC12EF
MGSLRLTLCAGLLGACALTPTAHAADGGGGSVSVTPTSPAAGADVALRVAGCSGRTATAVSSAFVADAHLAGTGGTLAGETRVRSTAEPGSYDVKITCADFEIKGRITVVAQGTQSAAPVTPAASPVAPVHAGGGGTAHFASVDTRSAAPGTAHAVTGLVLAGVAAVAVALLGGRRRRDPK